MRTHALEAHPFLRKLELLNNKELEHNTPEVLHLYYTVPLNQGRILGGIQSTLAVKKQQPRT